MPSSRSSLSAAWSNCDWATAQMFGASATGLVLAIRCAECLHAARVAGASTRHCLEAEAGRFAGDGCRFYRTPTVWPAIGARRPRRTQAVRSVPMTTDVLDAVPPALSPDQAADLARTHFGLEAAATAMVSERDQNFRLADADGGSWILKVSNAAEDRGVVEMEVAAVERIARLDRPAGARGAPGRRRLADRERRRRRHDPPRPAPAAVARTQRGRDRAGRRGGHAHRRGRSAHRRCAAWLLPPGGGPADLVGSAAPAGAGAAGATDRGSRPARAAGARARPLRRARGAGPAAAARPGHPQRRHARQPARG